jgi:hypothetical protein
MACAFDTNSKIGAAATAILAYRLERFLASGGFF